MLNGKIEIGRIWHTFDARPLRDTRIGSPIKSPAAKLKVFRHTSGDLRKRNRTATQYKKLSYRKDRK